jgi:hypothetical protein
MLKGKDIGYVLQRVAHPSAAEAPAEEQHAEE